MRIPRARLLVLAAALAACGPSPRDGDPSKAEDLPSVSAARPVAVDTPSADSATPVDSACLPYEPATVSITGRLERRMFYGPPNYGENPETDEQQTHFYVVPDTPICTRPGTDLVNDPKRDVELVQMVLDSAGYANAGPHLDSRVHATGTLFGQYTGHHHAPLLLMVDSIVPAEPAP